ncbi:MAG TPA: FecR domain-containing protein [Anseongella sp.]|nr:FecR domain-containing protein [Anseongella sp.]
MNDDLLVKHLLGEASDRERLRVEEWIRAAQANERHYEQLRLIWTESRKLAPSGQVDEDAAWERLRKRIGASALEERIAGQRAAKKPGAAREPLRWLRIAAGIALIFALGWIIRFLLLEGPLGSRAELASGQQVLEETLPDGSRVVLNKNTVLRYPRGFSGESREVTLQGEAFFNVLPDKSKPFLIRVNDVTVRVTGTSFNVKSSRGNTEVIVETGTVRVSQRQQEVELKAGERATATGESAALVKASTQNALYKYYRTQEFDCNRTPLGELVEVLNEAYGVRIVVLDKELEQLPITAVFKNESLEQILAVISRTFDIEIEHQENRILLKR